MESIWSRMWRAAKLENALYEEVEADTTLTGQAITVVIIVAVAGAIGGIISALIGGDAGVGVIIGGLIGPPISALIGYFVWAGVSLVVGKALGGTADYGEMLRALGYANSPNVLAIVSFIPVIGGLIAFIGAIWALVAGIVALRQALDFTTGKAIVTAIIGWIALMIVFVVIAAILAAMGLAGAAMLGTLGGGM
jgi:hypothetical protein